MKQPWKLADVAVTGVFAALVCAASFVRFDLPSPVGNTAIHLGNVLCILSGLMLGPWTGGLAAGIGSGLFDLLHPNYIASAPFTLVFKFFIGYFAGRFAFSGGSDGRDLRKNTVGGVVGSIAYVILYLVRSYLTARMVSLMTPGTALVMLAPKALTSAVNAAIAVACAIPLSRALRAALDRAGLWR